MRNLLFVYLCSGLMTVAPATEHVSIDLSASAPGSLFCTAAEAEDIRLRSENYAWARDIRSSIEQKSARIIERPLDVPRASGGWSALYHCEKDNAFLQPHEAGGHICRKCKAVYHGGRLDNAYISRQHEYWLGGLETLGWAYTLSQDERYAERAKEILSEYADFGEEDMRDNGSRTRLLPQSLDEARLLCKIAVGYDRVYQSPSFSKDDHDRIAKYVIEPILQRMHAADHGLSNWQAWHNAAIACAGLVLQDESAVAVAINGPDGFMAQLDKGVLDSGMWHERSPLYHFFALRGHIYLLEGMARSGYDFYTMPKVPGFFDAPMRWPYPDGTLPSINDSDRVPLHNYRELYEIGYRRCKRLAYEHLLNPRTSMWALVWGERGLPTNFEQRDLILTSSNDISDGLAILRDSKREIAVYLDYGETGASHSHPAVLGLSAFAFGDERIIDPGRIAYANPLYKEWYRQTVAHNAPIVGLRSQSPDRGKILNFFADDYVSMVRASASAGTADVELVRTALLVDGALLDVVQFRTDRDRFFDLPLHVNGKPAGSMPPEFREALGGAHGYQLIEDIHAFEEAPKTLLFDAGEGRKMRIRFFTGADETYIAEGIGRIPTERIPMLLQRSYTQQATFASVTEFLEVGENPRKVIYRDQDPIEVEFSDVFLELGDEVFITTRGKRYRVGTEEAVHVDEKGKPILPDPLEQAREALRRRNEPRLPGQRRP